jgi:hypothetical protein
MRGSRAETSSAKVEEEARTPERLDPISIFMEIESGVVERE